MKKILLVLLIAAATAAQGAASAPEKKLTGTVTLSGAWAIYPTAVAWAEAFQKIHPKVKVEVSAGGAGKGAADAIAGLVDIGMVSRDPDPAETSRGIIPVYILHDAVFPVISEKNPASADIFKNGISRDTWKKIYISGQVSTWGEAAGGTSDKKIHIYTRSDSCGAAASWAGYIGKKQEDLKGIGIYGDPGLLEAAKRDPLGVGYNNFSYVFNRDGSLIKGAKLAPIDSNNNGTADPGEILNNRDDAVKAIRSGLYPATRKNFFFLKKDASELAKSFIEFALSEEGGKIVDEVGASLTITKEAAEESLKLLK